MYLYIKSGLTIPHVFIEIQLYICVCVCLYVFFLKVGNSL